MNKKCAKGTFNQTTVSEQCDGLKKRRHRTVISHLQLTKLEKLYRQDQWPSRSKKLKLAKELGMTDTFVSIWFQNKRSRVKREAELLSGDEASDSKSKMTSTDSDDVDINVCEPFIMVVDDNYNCDDNEAIKTFEEDPPLQHSGKSTSNQNGLVTNVANSQWSPKDVLERYKTISDNSGNLVKDPFTMTEHVVNETGSMSNQQHSNTTTMSPKLFKAIINMVALVEGDIIKTTDAQFPTATTDALYGISLNKTHRLIYDKDVGLELIELKEL